MSKNAQTRLKARVLTRHWDKDRDKN